MFSIYMDEQDGQDKNMDLNLDLIAKARRFLSGSIRSTPVVLSPCLSEILSVPVFLKLEFLQETGSFKLRGALLSLAALSQGQKRKGVITCSAGNHGWALAYAGRKMELPVTVYTPHHIDESKRKGMLRLGARVVRTRFPGYNAAEAEALEQARQCKIPFLSPYDDASVMAGNGGTLAAELMDSNPEIGTFMVPVGGGGLAAGLAYYVKEKRSKSCVIGCQHKESPSLQRSLAAGQALSNLPPIRTSAGGLEGGVGGNAFRILKTRIDRVPLVSEKEILNGVRWMLSEHRFLIEPSAAVVVAACLTGQVGPLDSPAVLVLTGRNVAPATLTKIFRSAGR